MNSISKQILRSPLFFPKLLVGALLIYSLVGLPFFIGYLSRFFRQFRERHDPTLPTWNGWLALLVESWELLVILTVYAVLPMLLASWLSSAMAGWMGWLFWFPLWALPWALAMGVFFFAPMFASLAYHQYLLKGRIESAFDLRTLWNTLWHYSEELIALTLLFWGLMLIGFPLLGVAVALGCTLYFPLAFQIVDQQRSQSVPI